MSFDFCRFSILRQFKNPYISLIKKAIKQTTTEMYFTSVKLASIQRIISTRSFIAYATAKNELRLKVRYTAIKLVVTDKVLGSRLAVLK